MEDTYLLDDSQWEMYGAPQWRRS